MCMVINVLELELELELEALHLESHDITVNSLQV